MGKYQYEDVFGIAEYLRDEAKEVGHVHPRRYEHWEISVKCDEKGDWELLAKWQLHRSPTEDPVNWLLELVNIVSGEVCKLPESITGDVPVVRFTWKGERKTDERERSDRKSEQAARGIDGEEEDPRGVVGKLPRSGEATEKGE